ncbi:uncharacterized protein LOC120685368 [Panicum virgatum]|uniref:Uncharacterized protein n=1 Tax=Panicum virgatum TaxID=38727 RepID=A0A8T0P622_PANVG|nr:uncharacterized protein LOC120685368 [Panicum virgatum]KAG2555632.1 hypothetical protein PVAP13_8NG039200 [Panicum virgatum]
MEQEAKNPHTPVGCPSVYRSRSRAIRSRSAFRRALIIACRRRVIACRRRGGSFTLLLTPTPRPPYPTHHEEEFTVAGGRRCRGSARKGSPPPRILEAAGGLHCHPEESRKESLSHLRPTAMAKKKKLIGAKDASIRAMPRNTVSLISDGMPEQYLRTKL